jgi:uncharacterized protein with von Willebrand factor type A (vWA) domain
MSAVQPFRAASLETDYAFLDMCPEALLPALLALPFGPLSERVAGVVSWRSALLDGQLPSERGWPPAHVAAPARKALGEMNLVRFCKGQPELVDALLPDILASFRRSADEHERDVVQYLRELEELERRREMDARERQRPRGDRKQGRGTRESMGNGPIVIDPATRGRLEREAQRMAAARSYSADASLMDGWGEQALAWAEIAEVFGDLGDLMGRGWDLSLGVLKQTGWRDLLQLRKLLETLPQLTEVVRSLGRLHESEGEASVVEMVMAPIQRLEEERREIRVPYIPEETRGLERSGEISRMLPMEAVLLGHPALRMLWHARRAERGLMTYRVEGIDVETRDVLTDHMEEREKRSPRPERGPIIAIVDTSGSMHGAPERVAKALVLEALRRAHAEKRRCLVFLFSGLGQVEEQELSLAPEGIARLLAFIQLSFGGGTDETTVLRRVLQRLREQAWRKADVLFVTDGEWRAGQDVVQAVSEARALGTRFHGVQVGHPGHSGLQAICDPVHMFRDWAAMEGWRR